MFHRILFIFTFLIFLNSCEKPQVFETNGNLSFSSDSVKFDTLFTSMLSPTKRLMIYNTSNKNLEINSIEVLGGTNSEYSIILDGVKAQSHSNFQIAKGDSALIFVSLKSQSKEKITEDKIRFKMADTQQEIVLWAFARDAYFYRDSIVDTISKQLTLFTDKPNVIDGYLYVPEGCTLTIPAGANLFFTATKNEDGIPISRIIVDGTLQVNGSINSKCSFQAWRLDGDYPETAGQWFGIVLYQASKGNIISNALIKNSILGVEVDSIVTDVNPKLKLENTEFRNISQVAIRSVGAYNIQPANLQIDAVNCLVSNVGANCVSLFAGGVTRFINCTFYGNSGNFSRNSPVVGVKDWFTGDNNTDYAFPSISYFLNCIVTGSEESEFSKDFAHPNSDILFENCIVKFKSDKYTLPGTNCLENSDPQFENIGERNFKLKTGSVAIDFGKNAVGLTPFSDIEGKARQGNPDLGCYEF